MTDTAPKIKQRKFDISTEPIHGTVSFPTPKKAEPKPKKHQISYSDLQVKQNVIVIDVTTGKPVEVGDLVELKNIRHVTPEELHNYTISFEEKRDGVENHLATLDENLTLAERLTRIPRPPQIAATATPEETKRGKGFFGKRK